MLKLEHFIVTSTIQPLTALLGSRNGRLLSHPPTLRLVRILISETRRFVAFPRIDTSSPAVMERFSIDRLEKMVLATLEGTKDDRSCMWRDRRAGIPTDVQELSGEVVRAAEKINMVALQHKRILDLLGGQLKNGKALYWNAVKTVSPESYPLVRKILIEKADLKTVKGTNAEQALENAEKPLPLAKDSSSEYVEAQLGSEKVRPDMPIIDQGIPILHSKEPGLVHGAPLTQIKRSSLGERLASE